MEATAQELGRAFQRLEAGMRRFAEAYGREFRRAMLVRGSLWSRYTLGERELQRDRRREAKRPPVVWRGGP